jgi:hypothetical protein
MRNQDGRSKSIDKLSVTSFGAGLLAILSFFLMFNWTYGEYLIAPTLLFALISLVAGLVSVRVMKRSGARLFANTKIYIIAFGTLIGGCILLWFLVAIFTHY